MYATVALERKRPKGVCQGLNKTTLVMVLHGMNPPEIPLVKESTTVGLEKNAFFFKAQIRSD